MSEELITETFDENPSSFFIDAPVVSSPGVSGEPVVLSTLGQQDNHLTTQESNDLLPDIFITTEESVLETTQVAFEATKENDSEIVPVAEPADEHPDAEGPVQTNIADLVNLRDSEKFFFGFTQPQNLSTDDEEESPQGNFPGEKETLGISVADKDTSIETTISPQTTTSTLETTSTQANDDDEPTPEPDQEEDAEQTPEADQEDNTEQKTEPNQDDNIEPTPEPDQDDEAKLTTEENQEENDKPTPEPEQKDSMSDSGNEVEKTASISDTSAPLTLITSEENSGNENKIPSTNLESDQLVSTVFFKFVESSTKSAFEDKETVTSSDEVINIDDDSVQVNTETYESDEVPEFEENSSSSPVDSDAERPKKSEKRKVIRKKLKGSRKIKTPVSTNPPIASVNNRGTDDSTEEIDILDKEVKELEDTAAPEKLILPQPEQIAPFNSLSALFPYYTVDPESIVNEELMPILIEDIFLSEEYSGEADYDLLPFYDLDNYDLEFEDSFVVYDATSDDGDTEQEVPSF